MVNFEHKWSVKNMWKKGQLPTVKYGFYGDVLTIKNVSIEHLKPVSKGGKTELKNLVLASKEKNNIRGNDDLSLYVQKDNVDTYLGQFKGIKVRGFDGNKYIELVLRQLKNLGINL